MTANSTKQLDSKKYVLVISHDVIGAQMAGPGIRYYHIAEMLSRKFNVVLAIPNEPDLAIKASNLHLSQYCRGDWHSLQFLADDASVILMNGYQAVDRSNSQKDVCQTR